MWDSRGEEASEQSGTRIPIYKTALDGINVKRQGKKGRTRLMRRAL